MFELTWWDSTFTGGGTNILVGGNISGGGLSVGRGGGGGNWPKFRLVGETLKCYFKQS